MFGKGEPSTTDIVLHCPKGLQPANLLEMMKYLALDHLATLNQMPTSLLKFRLDTIEQSSQL